jgi:glycosyltransferase involved in cell wall biosynthesis
MNIALVVPGGVDRSGEVRVIPVLLWLIKRLARRHRVRVFAYAQEPVDARWTLEGAEVINIGTPLRFPRACRTIIREHRRDPFDVIHAVFAGAPGAAAVAAGRFLRVPVLVHLAGGELVALQDIGYGGALRWRGRIANRLTLANAARVTVASAPMLALAERYGIRAHRVPLGVDLETWPVRPPRTRTSAEVPRLLHVASINRIKNPELLLQTAALLRESGCPLHLDMIGEDTRRGEMQRFATRLNMDAHVTFHGFRTQAQLRPLVEAAHVHLVSSFHEAGPLAMLEAAVAGVPTVGTAVGHVVEWAPDAAISVDDFEPASLAAGIAHVLANEPLRLRLARAAQSRAIAENADITASLFEECYARLTS